MSLSSGTKNETLSDAEVSDKLSDAQLLEKFGIKPCFVKIFDLKSDECDAAVIKSSPQKMTVSNRPFDLNKEFQCTHSSEKQTEQINIACNTKRLLYYETYPDTTMIKELQIIPVNSDPEEKPSWMKGLRIEPMDFCEHLNRFHVPDSDSEIQEERDMAKHKSAKVVFKRKRSDFQKQSKRPRRNKQNTSEGKSKFNEQLEIEKERDMDLMTHRNNQPRLINKSNRTDSKVLKRKQSNISKKQEKLRKRNVQNRAVKAINNSDYETKKNDSILRKQFGIKDCFVSIPLIIPKIPILPQFQSFQVHYSYLFLEEITQKACLSARNKVIDLDRLYAETISQFSSLRQKKFNRQIRAFIHSDKFMSIKDPSIKDIQLISRSEEIWEAQSTKKILRYNGNKKCVIVDGTPAVHRKVRNVLNNLEYPLVLIEQNKEADFLARKLAEENKIVHEKSQQSDSNYKEHDSELGQMSEFPLRMDENLQDLNDDGNGKQPLISETCECETVLNYDDDGSTYAISKPFQDAEIQISLDFNALSELDGQLDDVNGKQPVISEICDNGTDPNYDDGGSTYAISKPFQDVEIQIPPDFNVLLELEFELDDVNGKQPLISENYEKEKVRNFNDNSSFCTSSELSEGLQSQIPLDLNSNKKLQQNFCETLPSAKLNEVTPYSQWPNTNLNIIKNDSVNYPPTAEMEINFVPFELINGDEHLDTTNALKEIFNAYPDYNPPSLVRESFPNIEHFEDTSTAEKSLDAANENNPPILNREIPLSMKHIDDTTEDNDLNAAIDEFFAIGNDEDYSEKN